MHAHACTHMNARTCRRAQTRANTCVCVRACVRVRVRVRVCVCAAGACGLQTESTAEAAARAGDLSSRSNGNGADRSCCMCKVGEAKWEMAKWDRAKWEMAKWESADCCAVLGQVLSIIAVTWLPLMRRVRERRSAARIQVRSPRATSWELCALPSRIRHHAIAVGTAVRNPHGIAAARGAAAARVACAAPAPCRGRRTFGDGAIRSCSRCDGSRPCALLKRHARPTLWPKGSRSVRRLRPFKGRAALHIAGNDA